MCSMAKALLFIVICTVSALLCSGNLGLRRFDSCSHKGQQGVCRWLTECSNPAPTGQNTICNSDAPDPLICCAFRGIFFPTASVSPEVTTPATRVVSTQCQAGGGSCVPQEACPTQNIRASTNSCEGNTDVPLVCCNTQVSNPEDNPEVVDPTSSPDETEVLLSTEQVPTNLLELQGASVDPITVTQSSDILGLDISNPFQDPFIPSCGFRADWSLQETPLPQYNTDGTLVSGNSEIQEGNSVVNAWPWTVLLGYPSNSGDLEWQCGGAFINREWILTAAHCLQEKFPVTVRLAEHDYSRENEGAPHQDFGVSAVEVYPEYSPDSAYNDLALVQLSAAVNYSDHFFQVRPSTVPVCLPWAEQSSAVLEGRTVALTGWGPTDAGEPNPVLNVEYLTVLKSEDCNRTYSSEHYFEGLFASGISQENFLCARDDSATKNICTKFSGSPLVYNSANDGFILAGMVANGYGCGNDNFPAIFTALHRPQYLDWIKRRAFN